MMSCYERECATCVDGPRSKKESCGVMRAMDIESEEDDKWSSYKG